VTWDGLQSYQQDFQLQGNFSVIPESSREIGSLPSSQLQVARACPYLSSASHH
jgi:hypothetical protein